MLQWLGVPAPEALSTWQAQIRQATVAKLPADMATRAEVNPETGVIALVKTPASTPAPAPAPTAAEVVAAVGKAAPVDTATAPLAARAAPGATGESPRPRPASASGDPEKQLRGILEEWRAAWSEGDTARYLRFYDPAFTGGLANRAAWEKQRRERLANGRIALAFDDVRISIGNGTARVAFVQRYASDRHSDKGTKAMTLRQSGDGWVIVDEQWHLIKS